MPSGLSSLRWLPGGEHLAAVTRAELPQKDGLAAAFTALAALRAAGIAVTDQDEVALAAGTVRLTTPDRPPGEPARTGFRLRLPETDDPAAAGTSATGLARAIGELSAGRLRAIPASGDWTVDSLFDLLAGLGELPRVAVLARVESAELGAPDTPERALLDYLDTGVPPLWSSRWRAEGEHFVLLAGVRIGAEGTLLSVVDTYPSLGDNGIHEQPIEWLVAALRREPHRPGGLLLVVDATQAAAATEAVTAAGLRSRPWEVS
ncbi:DUF6885 family protein [Amycolatopsis sp. H20-H5]|uniref:DUF6885 family protein n=1 Tax=Amycolatopsis sp. H20-H5 TaxID=3046309 RepID=UPI002DB5DA64|nr:hypothetical protein [Amycolatopsis sp. H20-H5]MEC3974706.1 hypothetical protein [Amycolatopsis sp. H20-H5]